MVLKSISRDQLEEISPLWKPAVSFGSSWRASKHLPQWCRVGFQMLSLYCGVLWINEKETERNLLPPPPVGHPMSQLCGKATLLLNSLERYCSLARYFQQSRNREQGNLCRLMRSWRAGRIRVLIKKNPECLRIWGTVVLGFPAVIARNSLSGLQPASSRYMLKSQQMSPLGSSVLSVCMCILKWNHLWTFFLHLRLCCCAHHIQTCCSDKGLCVQCLNTFSPWLLGRSWGSAFFEAHRRWEG